jgi:aminopeptidase
MKWILTLHWKKQSRSFKFKHEGTIMTDIRMQRLAKLLVNYSVEAQKGEWVNIATDVNSLPLARLVHHEVVLAGANPTLQFTDEAMLRDFFRHADESQLDWMNPFVKLGMEQADCYINLRSTGNTRAMTNINPKRIQRQAAARRPVMQTYMRRAADGVFKWTLTQFPTEASAQEANMSLEEYEDFVYSATYCDHDDPIAKWQAVEAEQQSKVDWLAGKDSVVLKGPNIDLSLSIKGRKFLNAGGRRNMPDGEIFTGPVEDSVNGWVRFTYPSIVSGRAVSGIELTFENGKVVKASAEENEDLLFAQLDTDEGSRYPDTGGLNQSAVHWDMICDMRTDSEIHVDGDLFYRNGQFTV